jgi:transcriptional regulator with XRE-family HTH domain
MSTNRDRFANRLRELRESKGYSAARHFAHALGISENRYTRYERGVSEPNLDLIYQICRTLQITPDDLFDARSDLSTPGFSSGAQTVFDGVPPARQRSDEPRSGRPLDGAPPVAAPAREVDAAAWDLAATVVKLKTAHAASAAPRSTMATLGDIGRLFGALRHEPFDTVARIVIDPELQRLPDIAAADLEASIERLLALRR